MGKARGGVGWRQLYGLSVVRVEVLDERVGGGKEAVEALSVARSREIEGNAQLVGVEQAAESALPGCGMSFENGPCRREGSPSGGSTSMIVAPRSARQRAA